MNSYDDVSQDYYPSIYDGRQYAPPQYSASDYDQGYGAGKMTAAGLGTAALGAALAFFVLKCLDEK